MDGTEHTQQGMDRRPTPSPRLLAFYLPQFHPAPENDVWWGDGYTEWTNVARSRPRFEGHYQPRLPADLGFYDLRLPEVRQAQADLAREHGVHGFCYYHYWFKGRRMLERPFQEVLESGEPDFPFCLAWTNHTWTWKRDHSMQARLVEQEYSEEDDREHIRWLLSVFRDERYIRVNGRPLVLIYWVHSLPDPQRTFEIWREEAEKAGEEEPYICKMDTFGNFDDPRGLGCDASVEFWPHGIDSVVSQRVGHEAAYRENQVFEYRRLVLNHLSTQPPEEFNRFPCVVPGWDNSARWKSTKPRIIHGSTPELYRAWLEGVIRRNAATFEPDEQLVFINAWNEWGESAYLEPDVQYGKAYLEATSQALSDAGAEVQTYKNESPEIPAPASAETRYQRLLEKYKRLQEKFDEWSSLEENLPLVQKAERLMEETRGENQRLNRENSALEKRHNDARRRLKVAEERLAKLSGAEQIWQENARLRQERQKLLNQPGGRRSQENQMLENWLRQLDNGIKALLESRRWKIGDASGKALNKVLRRQEDKNAADHLQRVLQEFRAWKSKRDDARE